MSTLRTNALQNAAGSKSVPVDTVVDGTAKAWVNFNGTGTVAIRAAFNVSSITDNGTGQYTVNFTTAMPDAKYAAAVSAKRNGNLSFGCTHSAGTVSAIGVESISASLTAVDAENLYVSIFR